MLIHYFSGRVLEGHLAGQHFPERHPKRVEIRTNIDSGGGKSLELSPVHLLLLNALDA